jgi:hypothetical protein
MKPPPKKQGTDIINEVLEDYLMVVPDVSPLILSFYQQYQKRGFLTKKQLQGLHSKASTIPDISAAKLATLEAIIKKMPNRYKSELPQATPLYEKDETTGSLISDILGKYPQHKRVLYFRNKYDNNEPLSVQELEELKRFHKLLK